MKKIWMLTAANIRKAKGQAASLLLFVLIAAMFLNIGLMLYIDYGKSFETRYEQLNAPHMLVLQPENVTTDEQQDYLRQYPQVVEFEKQNVISGYGDYVMNGAKATAIIILSNFDSQDRKSTRLNSSH